MALGSENALSNVEKGTSVQMGGIGIWVHPFLDGGVFFVENDWVEDNPLRVNGIFILGKSTIEFFGRLMGLSESSTYRWKHNLSELLSKAIKGEVDSGDAKAQAMAIFECLHLDLAYQDWQRFVLNYDERVRESEELRTDVEEN